MTEFDRIREKVLNGLRLTEEDALYLFESPRLLEIGQLADLANSRKHKDNVFYNQNTHLNPTNVCVMSCKFCAFARKPGEEGAFAYSLEEILEKASKAVESGAKELHMVGGLHPKWSLDYYANMFRSIKEKYPHIHIKGMTAVEIDWLARKSRKSHSDVLFFLKEAGLDSLPGGGAEIFHPDCRDIITAKLSTEKWVDIHRTAHQMGMKSNCTMLYGHIEKYEHRVFHFKVLRDLQDETGGFNCFIPLAFQPENNEMGIDRYTFGADDLKTIAVARLYLDNFQQIKSYWVMLGQDIAQLALHFGANDMDGTVVDEKISIMAGGRAGIGMELKNIKRLIMKSRKNPQERDTLYNVLESEKPSILRTQKDLIKDILKKALDHVLLNTEELTLLAEHADLFTLAITAQKIRNDLLVYNQASFHRSQFLNFSQNSFSLKENLDVILDLGTLKHSLNGVAPKQFLKTLSNLKEQNSEIVISGFSGLWKLVQASSLSLSELFGSIQDIGIQFFGSSSLENESSLTHREIVKLHQTAHEEGLLTYAKCELNSPLTELSPIWKTYIERILALRTLQEKTHGILSLSIEPASDSWVTAQEYVRAVALARIASPNIDHIQVPFMQLPISREVHMIGESVRGHLRGQEKYAPLLVLSGADDLGTLPDHFDKVSRIYEEISSVGMQAYLRDNRFVKVQSPWEEELEKSFDLRHVPLHKMTGKEFEQSPYLGLN